MTGRVKWFKSEKGYGFIESPDFDADIFVHHSQIQMEGFRLLEQGEKVQFELERNDKGLFAVEVRRLGKNA